MDAAIKKFKIHPSILMIKEKVNISDKFSFTRIGTDYIVSGIRRLYHTKVNTFNDIPTKILKENCDTCCQALHDILSNCIENSNFLDELKLAHMTPIVKKDDSTAKKNYRNISLQPT